MHDVKAKLENICEMKKRLVDIVETELKGDLAAIDAHELGEVVDMIKDLAEVEKLCHEACYYESVVEAMNEYDDYPMYNDRMGYPRGRNAKGQFMSRRGYEPDSDRMHRGRYPMMDGKDARSGYDSDWRMDEPHTRPGESPEDWDDHYGRPFNQFRKARRHYTETHSESDKVKMKQHAMEHMNDMIATMREIYDDADPDLKKKMKTDLTKFATEMTV